MNEDYVNNICTIYEMYGYRQFRMSKFEEYDLYVRNKDFLLSDKIITFNDTNGKLMALKPDVTLSIIKSSRENPETVKKVFYDENVYRVSKGTDTFSEIRQIGLECIGKIDLYSVAEVIMLAAKTLEKVSGSYILEISDFSLVTDLLTDCGISDYVMEKALQCIGNKNLHDLTDLLKAEDVDCGKIDVINRVSELYGEPEKVISGLRKILPGNKSIETLDKITSVLRGYNVRIDFSLTGNKNYYNGLIFKGYIDGIPESVLSGGQYDRLLQKMKRSSGAIGFALYTNLLEVLDKNIDEFDADNVILYPEECDVVALNELRDSFTENGMNVYVCSSIPERFRYRKLYMFDGKEVTEVG